MKATTLVAVLAVVMLVSGAMLAQNIITGAVAGTVTDPSKAVVAGASVTLTSNATGEVLTTKTNDSGGYLFALVKPGSYTLKVAQQGFRASTASVQALVGQTTAANIQLALGVTSETVEVVAGGELLQTETASIVDTIGTRDVEKVPNGGGDLTAIAFLSPGVQMNATAGFGYGNFSAFGLPGTANLFTINGNDYNDPFLNLNNSGSSNLLLGSSEIQEVAVVVNGYTGQYGRQAGAQVDYVTKSGSNVFHGDVSYDWTGRALAANDYFLNQSGTPRPYTNNNIWGADFGGPIKKDKLFFFVHHEGIRYIFGTSTAVVLPSQDLENYLKTSVPASQLPFYQNIFKLYNATPGAQGLAATPDSCPASLPAALFPAQDCTVNFSTSGANGNQEWRISTRVDYDIDQKDKAFARVTVDRGHQPTYTDVINPIFNIESNQPQWDAQVSFTHTFNSRMVNNLIASNVFYSAIFQSPVASQALAVFPYNLDVFDVGLTPLGLGGAFGNFFPQGRRSNQWQLVDDLSVTRGNHSFKMGVSWRRNFFTDFSAEAYGFPEVAAYLGPDNPYGAAAAFSEGGALSTSQSLFIKPSQPLGYYSLGAYFQDEFRVNRKLKLTMTLRADRNSPGYCKDDCATLSVVPFDQLSHDPNIPYSQMITTNQNQILRNVEKIVFQPRFGFTWSPIGEKTVFRGGVGLFTDLYPGVLLDTYTRNFPAVTSYTINLAPLSGAGSGAALVGECNSVFQSTLANPNGTVADFLATAPAGCTVPQLGDVPTKVLNPKYVEWNFEVQRSIDSKTVVSANYVGNHGYDLILLNGYLNAYDINGFGGLPTTPADTRVGTVQQLSNNGYSNYNGLTLSVKRQVWHGLSGGASYTYSHSLDNVSNGGVSPYNLFGSILTQISPFNPAAAYGSSDNDLRHYFEAHYVWDLPFKSGNRFLDRAIGGWTVAGTFFYHTGVPFSLVDGATAGGLDAENATFFGGGQATVLAQPNTSIPTTCTSVTTPCYTAADFATSTTFVGSGRNAFRGPGFFNSDLSLAKRFKVVGERVGFSIGANAYNVLNVPHWYTPGNNISGANAVGCSLGLVCTSAVVPTSPFGSFAGASFGRLVQVMGKIDF